MEEEIGHAVTAESSPDPGPTGEWKIRDNEDGCENALLTITMGEVEIDTGTGGSGSGTGGSDVSDVSTDASSSDSPDEDSPEPIEAGETKTCITDCSADPSTYEYCCDALTDDTWCYEGFRKLRRATGPAEL